MSVLDIKKEIFGIKRSLLQILKEYENKSLTSDEFDNIKKEIYDLYVKYLKLYVKYSGKPDSNKEWNFDNNCYYYALELPTPDIFIEVYDRIFYDDLEIEVGSLSGLPYVYDDEYSKDILLAYLDADLSTLGIESYPSSINAPLEHNGYKIAIFYDEENKDYHFVRQNSDRLWSQKYGLDKTIALSDSPLSYLNDSPLPSSRKHNYEYIKTLELVKPSMKR